MTKLKMCLMTMEILMTTKRNKNKKWKGTVGNSRRPTRLAYHKRKTKITEVNCLQSRSDYMVILLKWNNNLSNLKIYSSYRMLLTTKLVVRHAKGKKWLWTIWILKMKINHNLIKDIVIILLMTYLFWHQE